jgi:CBS domain-containing protein
MTEKPHDHSHAQKPGASATPEAAHEERGHKDHFLRLMFFQASHGEAEKPPRQVPEPLTGDYVPLRQFRARPGVRYTLDRPGASEPVQFESPATAVMTDLRRVGAVTIGADASVHAANQTMIDRRVRALFVVDEARQVLGLVTATDALGERPVKFAQEHEVRHSEVMVRDVMTPADQLEVLDFREVTAARVGDMVATLRVAGRQHALAVEVDESAAPGATKVRGIFSLTQIARQLGIPPTQTHDIARTFTEILSMVGR